MIAPTPTPAPTNPIDVAQAFTADVAKALLTHKKAAGLASLRQNYKGTGAQRARRQLWIQLANGSAIDVWLDPGSYTLGGVTALRVPGRWDYGDRTPHDVAAEIAGKLKPLSIW